MVRIGHLLAIALLAACARGPAQPPPNVIVILTDDQGHGDVGVYGSTEIPTPHIDSIAEHGVRFTNGYVSAPQCAPSRAGLLTGRDPNRFGFEENSFATLSGLPREEVTFAERMRAAGYATGLIGKWHLGGQPENRPLKRGFDESFGFFGADNPYLPPAGQDSIPKILRGEAPVVVTEYLTRAFGHEAAAFIERHQHGPFFLYLAFNAPHSPLQAPPDALERFAHIQDPTRRTYAAMVSSVDDAVGDVLAKLVECGLEQETLVFFLSDNGGPLEKEWNGSSNAPLRGGKGSLLEGGIRVPFLVQWKGRLPAGAVYEQPVTALDVLPTALAAAGVEPHPDWQLDGVDLLPFLEGELTTPPHDVLFWRFIFRPQRPTSRFWAIRQGDWKLLVERVEFADRQPRVQTALRLFNLRDDPGEQHDLSAAHPDRVRELSARWAEWDAKREKREARRKPPAGSAAAPPADR